MGVYYDHGVEYRVIFGNRLWIAVVNTKASDTRLETSLWYASRRNDWWSNETLARLVQPQQIGDSDTDFDIRLTKTEQDLLISALEDASSKGGIVTHGWFEVLYTSNSLES